MSGVTLKMVDGSTAALGNVVTMVIQVMTGVPLEVHGKVVTGTQLGLTGQPPLNFADLITNVAFMARIIPGVINNLEAGIIVVLQTVNNMVKAMTGAVQEVSGSIASVTSHVSTVALSSSNVSLNLRVDTKATTTPGVTQMTVAGITVALGIVDPMDMVTTGVLRGRNGLHAR